MPTLPIQNQKKPVKNEIIYAIIIGTHARGG